MRFWNNVRRRCGGVTFFSWNNRGVAPSGGLLPSSVVAGRSKDWLWLAHLHYIRGNILSGRYLHIPHPKLTDSSSRQKTQDSSRKMMFGKHHHSLGFAKLVLRR